MRALIRNSLRMRPDRIIVGEIRGEEAFDFIQAMNTGHDGSMGTMHANSAHDALSRLEALIALGVPTLPSHIIQMMIISAIDIIIAVRRLPNGVRTIDHILEILGPSEQGILTNSIFHGHQGTSASDNIRNIVQRKIKPILSERIRRKEEFFHQYNANRLS